MKEVRCSAWEETCFRCLNTPPFAVVDTRLTEKGSVGRFPLELYWRVVERCEHRLPSSKAPDSRRCPELNSQQQADPQRCRHAQRPMRVILGGACVPVFGYSHTDEAASISHRSVHNSADAVGCNTPSRRKGLFRARMLVIHFAAFVQTPLVCTFLLRCIVFPRSQACSV